MLPIDLVPKEKQPKKADEKKRESFIEGKVKDYARSLGLYVRKYTTPGNASSPDDIFVDHRNGTITRFFFIEFKASGEKPTEAQKDEHELMRSYGMTVYWTDSVEEGKAIICGLL